MVPELMQNEMTGERIAAETARLLDDAAERGKMKEELARVAALLSGDGRRRKRCDRPRGGCKWNGCWRICSEDGRE